MESLLFFAPIEWDDSSSGVSLKVKNEYKILGEYYDAYISAFEGNDVIVYHNEEVVYRDSRKKHRVLKQFDLADFVLENKIENVYIRYALAFPQQINMLKHIRKSVRRIVVEFPDYPYIHEWTKGKRYLQAVMDCTLRRRFGRYVDHAFACTNKKKINGIPTTQLINGTNTSEYSIKEFSKHDYLGVLSVSSMSKAHGIDRFIQGLSNYYLSGGKRNILFHIVGNGAEYENIKKLVEMSGLQEHVIMHGFIPNSRQQELFDKCDIGLGAIGFHRINIKDDSTLKSREYGLRGMPIVAENKIDILDNDYKYVMYCPWDDSPVDIDRLISFYDFCISEAGAENCGKDIRNYFLKCCDISETMKPVIEYLQNE